MRPSLFLAAGLLLSGCNLVYKQDIQQGNVLEAEDVEQLERGMSKRQVSLLLGSPSVDSPFHEDRWDYVSTFARRGGEANIRHLTLRFDGSSLASVDGDYLDEAELSSEALEELRDRDEEQLADPRLREPEQEVETPVGTSGDG